MASLSLKRNITYYYFMARFYLWQLLYTFYCPSIQPTCKQLTFFHSTSKDHELPVLTFPIKIKCLRRWWRGRCFEDESSAARGQSCFSVCRQILKIIPWDVLQKLQEQQEFEAAKKFRSRQQLAFVNGPFACT